MKLLDRYIAGMVALFILGAVFAFSILIICNNFYASSDLLFKDKIPFSTVALINLLDAPATIVLSLPVASLFGVMLAIGQLGRQSELTAMRCGGISLSRIMMPILGLALFLSAAAWYLDEHLVPKASNRAYELKKSIGGDKKAMLETQDVFFKNQQGTIIYAGNYDSKALGLSRVMLLESENKGTEANPDMWTRITLAFNGKFEGDELILTAAKAFLYNSEGELKGREEIPEVRREFPKALQEIQGNKRDASTLAGGEIAEQISRAQEAGRSPVAYQTDLQFKYSIPVACFIFSFVGFIFSIYSPRKETFMGMLYAIILVLIYYVFISVFKSLGKQGVIPYPVVSAWSTNVIYLLFGIFVFSRVRR
jgi:LPS export ABC transporter permease LptG